MEQPLGRTAGNAVEVEESVEVLAGGGPEDLVEVTLALAREMVELAGLEVDPADALADGRAMDRWRAIVAAQGGDPDAPLPVAAEHEMLTAEADGVVQRLDAMAVGVAAWRLGAGRARKEDAVSATAGVICHAKVGNTVRAGDPVLELRADDPSRFAAAREALTDAWTLGSDPADSGPLILDRITPE
jgi:thymidine phosphorylase